MDKKTYTPIEVATELKKSLYKMVKKALNSKDSYKEEAQAVVEDVLDPNYRADVNPSKIPSSKDGVLWKSKGVKKLKKFKKDLDDKK